MPPQKRTQGPPAATSGRRDPSLLTAGPELEEPLAQHMEGEGLDDGQGEMLPGGPLLVDGDIVTCSVTLAIDLMGDGRTSFVGYKATTRCQPEEDDQDVYGRLAQVVNQGVLTAVDDTIDSLEQYAKIRAERADQLSRLTS